MDEQQPQADTQLRARVDTLEVVVREGFDRVNRTFDRIADQMEKAEHRDEERAQQIHERLDRIADQSEERTRQLADKASEHSFTKPGILIAVVSLVWAVLAGVLAWGLTQSTAVAVARTKSEFTSSAVSRIQTKMDSDDIREREDAESMAALERRFAEVDMHFKGLEDMLAHQAEWQDHESKSLEDARRQIAVNTTQISDQDFEIKRLHNITDAMLISDGDSAAARADHGARLAAIEIQQNRRWPQFLENAEARGRLTQLVEGLRAAYNDLNTRVNTARPDPFFGAQGAALDARIRALEDFLRNQPTEAKE
jgi:ElaB/YqjD/DUF883 family membrane-anchored ribosome-binding protein